MRWTTKFVSLVVHTDHHLFRFYLHLWVGGCRELVPTSLFYHSRFNIEKACGLA